MSQKNPTAGTPPATTSAGTTTAMEAKHNQWLIQIQDHLPRDLDHIIPISSCIFPVPDRFTTVKPESFAPQLIAVGPLHHFRNALMLMETFKLGAAKRARTRLQLPNFNAIVGALKSLGPEVRACYAEQLTVNDHVLAWIMCIDGLFLLDLFAGNTFRNSTSVGTRSRVKLYPWEKTKIKSSVVGDVMKLENQIPIFVLEEISRMKTNEEDDDDFKWNTFFGELQAAIEMVRFCVEISPFQARDAYPHWRFEGIRPRHLLDLLYHLILLMGIPRPTVGRICGAANETSSQTTLPSALQRLWGALGQGNQQLVKWVTVPVTFFLQVLKIFGISDHLEKLLKEEKSLIPSATKLKAAGVLFKAVTTVRDIGFKNGERTLNLTEFAWKDNQTTGTVLRNLIAYESVAKHEYPILAGYCELVQSLVRTAEDLEVLMEAGVIRVAKRGDEPEAAVIALFKELGVSGEAKHRRVSKTVAGVNDYYNGVPTVKLKAAGRKCLQYSWKILMVLAVVLLLCLFTIQTVCQLADCKNLLKI